jgi:hypothetical protein
MTGTVAAFVAIISAAFGIIVTLVSALYATKSIKLRISKQGFELVMRNEAEDEGERKPSQKPDRQSDSPSRKSEGA